MNQDEIVDQNHPITIKVIEFIIKTLPKNKFPGADGFTGKLTV